MARRRVLLVGSDSVVAAMLRQYFDLRDLESEWVEYGDDALTALSRQPFDLVLVLSIFTRWKALPSRTVRFGGMEVLKQMRALAGAIPVVVASFAEVEEETLAHGGFAFVPKPIDFLELDRVVAAALGSSGRPL